MCERAEHVVTLGSTILFLVSTHEAPSWIITKRAIPSFNPCNCCELTIVTSFFTQTCSPKFRDGGNGLWAIP